jgi:hypothetical protein
VAKLHVEEIHVAEYLLTVFTTEDYQTIDGAQII